MDVSCERCKAEYEFDDSLLGEHGTTVKCSSCQHVFRVLPQSRQPIRPSLKVRTLATGRIEPLSSLRDLQRRIHAGEVSIDDELGREGFPWRKLGDVPELRSFFVKTANPLEPRSGNTQRPLHQAPLPRGAAALSVSQSSMPAPPRDPPANGKRTIIGVGPQQPQIPGPPRMPNLGGPLPAAKPAVAATPAVKPGSATASQGARPGGPVRTSFDSDAPTDPPPPGASSRPRSGAPAAPSNPVSKLYLAEDEAPPARATESSSRIWLIAGIAGAILLVAVIVIGAWRSRSPSPEVTPAPRVEAIAPKPSDPPPGPAAPVQPNVERVAAAKPASKAELAAKTEPAPDTTATAAKAEGADEGKRPRANPPADNEEEPKDYGGFVARGDAAMAKGDSAAAQEAYSAALAMRASGAEAATGLGYALLAAGKGREAVPHFERAARNGYAEASVGLGDAHKKLGDVAAARSAYNRYLQRVPNGARAGYVRKQLEALKGGGGGAEEPSEAAEEAQPEPSGADEYRPAGELVAPPPEPAPEPAAPEGEAP